MADKYRGKRVGQQVDINAIISGLETRVKNEISPGPLRTQVEASIQKLKKYVTLRSELLAQRAETEAKIKQLTDERAALEERKAKVGAIRDEFRNAIPAIRSQLGINSA
jgi:predicted  nucleic acid-binding Zn-ribbon protein